MFLLFGERVYSEAKPDGEYPCGICSVNRSFNKVIETNYFCLFGIRLLPIEKIANYLQCTHCNNAYAFGSTHVPSQIAPIKKVLTYIQLGYGLQARRDLLQDICLKVSSYEYSNVEIADDLRDAMKKGREINEYLKGLAPALNTRGKQEIIEAAFLMTHACCEIQYEDRLRINLMGNALGVSLEFVTSVINHIHAQGCYGVKRLLPTEVKAS